jgi:hypothetical protein
MNSATHSYNSSLNISWSKKYVTGSCNFMYEESYILLIDRLVIN